MQDCSHTVAIGCSWHTGLWAMCSAPGGTGRHGRHRAAPGGTGRHGRHRTAPGGTGGTAGTAGTAGTGRHRAAPGGISSRLLTIYYYDIAFLCLIECKS